MKETYDEFTPGMLESIGRHGSENQEIVKKLARFALDRTIYLGKAEHLQEFHEGRFRALQDHLAEIDDALGTRWDEATIDAAQRVMLELNFARGLISGPVEYRAVEQPGSGEGRYMEVLNEQGRAGWRLCAKDYGYFIFVRPAPLEKAPS